MTLDRKGELLWSEWDGEGYNTSYPDSIIYFTEAHITLDEPVVLRALASAIQRDGVVDSLGDAYKLIERFSLVSQGHMGLVDTDASVQTICDELGETYYGDEVVSIAPVTFVEVSVEYV